MAVRNINNAKAAVFFGSFFVYIVNEGHREDGENFRALDLGIYRLLGALGLHLIGYEMQMTYFLRIVIRPFSIKSGIACGTLLVPVLQIFQGKTFLA